MDDILEMEHDERHMWIEEISKINKKINEASKQPPPEGGLSNVR